jgi:hypothetical protein
MTTFASRNICVSIDRPVEVVYNFTSNPENLPKWASGLGKSITKVKDAWLVETPQGSLQIRFTARNDFGVLDHYVRPESGPEIYIPMRVVANGAGSEIIFTLFRLPHMSEEKFAADADWVRRDLNGLKAILEAE